MDILVTPNQKNQNETNIHYQLNRKELTIFDTLIH